jgi:hypothetical protein
MEYVMNRLKAIIVAATMLLSTTSVQAGFVESDWKNPGDALATLDTDTGIEWLDLTQTNRMSINQVESLTGAGSTFDGWRLPSRAEVTQMMVNAFPSIASKVQGSGKFSVTNSTTLSESNEFQNVFGKKYASPYQWSFGFFKNDSGEGSSVLRSGAVNIRTSGSSPIQSNASTLESYADNSAYHGVYLVSDGGTTQSSQLDPSINSNNVNYVAANVSAPALLSLMGLGLFGFAARRRSSTTLSK